MPDIVLPADPHSSLTGAAIAILGECDPHKKAQLSRQAASAWRAGRLRLPEPGDPSPPDRPGRPERPELRLPRDMPKRRKGYSAETRIALMHALAHIELNAIDLAWDIVCRFPAEEMPREFHEDWIKVGDDEAKHFLMLSDRLAAMGATYGDLPAHDGLWQASEMTAHDLAARLAVVPMVLEARGLDVTPAMIDNLIRAGDQESAAALRIIHDDEITHVAAGTRWFRYLADKRGWSDPLPSWQELVRTHFRGQLKRPFNVPSRDLADFPQDWYEPLADTDWF